MLCVQKSTICLLGWLGFGQNVSPAEPLPTNTAEDLKLSSS